MRSSFRLNPLKANFGLTLLFITHDLALAKYMSDRLIVMNKGRIEETGLAEEIYRNPQQEYTWRLIAAVPEVG